MQVVEDLYRVIVEGEWNKAVKLSHVAIDSGVNPQDIILNTFQPAMEEVGKRYSAGEYFLPDMLMSSRAMNASMEIVEPLLVGDSAYTIGKIIIGTVKGDIHDIGKNIVAVFLRGVGFEMIDLGTDISAETFSTAVQEHNPDILALSALLTTTMPYFEKVITALEALGLRAKVKIIVGGAPVSPLFAEKVGADGYAKDGGEAIFVCRELVGK